MKVKKAPYDFKAGDEVWVFSFVLCIIFPFPSRARDRVERVEGNSVFLAGGGCFHRITGKELSTDKERMPPRNRVPRWICPVTEQDREAAARADLIQMLRAVDWTKMPTKVLEVAAAVLPKPSAPTVKDLQHWLDDGTVVDNRDGTVTMGVADFRRLVIEPEARKEASAGRTKR